MGAAVGWVAAAVFAASYFFRRPSALRAIQAAAACLWIAYGLAMGSMPVVAANVLVAAAAMLSLYRARQNGRSSPAVKEDR